MDIGTEVWIKCDDAVWAPGVVLDCQEMHVTGVVKIKATSGDIVTRRYVGDGDEMNEIFLRNKRRDFANLSCLIVLEYLHEPALLHALNERFAHDRIYTSIGDILLAVNPFKDLDLYTDAVIEQYKTATIASVKTAGGAAAAALDATDGNGAACPPHVFAIAGRAFSGLLRADVKNQSILVSGESGSGKTESTKFLMKFLTSVGHDFSSAAATLSPYHAPPPDTRMSSDEDDLVPAGDITEIGKRILQTNPILESFGNARTIRNDNSSRFGKFIKIQFDAQNQIIGAEIASYLLEKVRLIHQSPQERNFHIFYELLEGADSTLLESLGLEQGAKYELLNAYGSGPPSSGGSGRSVTFAGMKRKNPLAAQYSKRFQQTVQAFADTGVEDGERTLIFQILAALLHLGNVNFEQVATPGSPEEAAVVTEKSSVHLEKCTELLGVEVEKLKSLLLTREITAGSDTVTLKLNAEQSKDASRSFAKAIYGRLFTWLVSRLSDGINYRDYLSPQEQNEIKTIGILDIFGFESLEENGFEQLCINYANERLQAQFNEFVFIKEQDIYVSQGIDWRSISYPSNAACLALFDEKVNGLFSLLDQECMMPKGSNQALCTKYYRSHGGTDITESLLQPQLSQRYTLPLLVTSFGRYLQNSSSSTISDKDENDDKSRPFTATKMDRVNKQFSIKHFAGKVTYRVDQFLEKNQDSLPTDASVVLTTSENDIVAMIGAGEGIEDAPESNGRGRARSRSRSSLLRAPSVSFQFRGQLDLLIDEIGQTEAHYIRCLKPNEEKKPRAFDRLRMVEQLRSVGVLEALRIARAGYSARLSHETFVDSFSCYRYKLERSGQSVPTELADLCKALVAVLMDEANSDKMDANPPVKTLLKVDNAKFNDAVREYGVQLGKSIVFCKTAAYNTFIRLRLHVRDQAARILQRYGRGFVHRNRYLKQRRAVLMIQVQVRRHQAVQFFRRMRTLRQRVAAYCIQRCMREAIVRQRGVDEKIRLHQLRRGFANFRLGCVLKAQEEEELLKEARRIEEEQVGENHVTDSEEEREQQRLQRKASSRGKGIARNTKSNERVEVSKSTRRLRSSSEEPEGEQGGDQSLRSEIERLQKLLGEQRSQKPAMQRRRSGRTTRSRVTSLDVSNARRCRSRRAMSIEKSDGMSEADDEDDDDAAHPAPRRAQSVRLARDADHVLKLTRRLEELDAKCRQLERLVARPPGPYEYPSSRGSSRRRYSIANSDGSNGSPDYPFDQQSNGGGSATSGVENLIWSIQQQMDTLRQSVASKAEEDTAAIQARHDGHSMSFASSLPTRSSTVTSNGSSTNQPFDGPLHEAAEASGYPSLPSPSRTNSDPHFSYRGYSFHGAMTPPTPASEASFRMGGVPRHPNAATGYPYGPPPPVVKWSRSTHCHECNDPFTLFVRRHHCRMCGNSFCHDHSNRRVTLLGMGFDDEPQRVCDACFAEYQAQASASPDYFPPLPTPTSVRGGAPPQHFGAPMYRQRSFSQQYYPPPPAHPHQYHAHVPRTPQRQHHHQQQPYYGGWAPAPSPHASSHTSAA